MSGQEDEVDAEGDPRGGPPRGREDPPYAAATGTSPRPGPVLRPRDVGLGLLFQTIRDAVVVGEVDSGRIALWNPAAEAMFGYAADEVVGRRIELLIPEPLRSSHRAGLARYAASGRGPIVDADTPVEVPALCKSGQEIAVEFRLTPITAARPPYRFVLAIIRDVTERRRVELEREALYAAAREQNRRLAELARLKDDFTAMVAHELGAPIAAIRGLADLAEAGALPPDRQRGAMAAIRREADALRSLVADVQAVAVVERDDFAVRPVPVDLGPILADAAAFARTLPGDHPLACPTDVPARVLADPQRIGQVLRNLLGNAAKFAPPGTPIEIRVVPGGERVAVEVVDRGPGIHPDDLGCIFEKYGRGRGSRAGRLPGHGLGLYLSSRIVRAHGGELTVRSTLGQGSVFGFSLGVAA